MRYVCYGDHDGFYGYSTAAPIRVPWAEIDNANPATFANYTWRTIYSSDILSGMSHELHNSLIIYNQPSLGSLPDGDPVDSLHVNVTTSLASVFGSVLDPSLASVFDSVLDSMAITPVRASPSVVTIDPMSLMLLIGISSFVLAAMASCTS